jgi:hypothetical protein
LGWALLGQEGAGERSDKHGLEEKKKGRNVVDGKNLT